MNRSVDSNETSVPISHLNWVLPSFITFIKDPEQVSIWMGYHKDMLAKNFYLYIFSLMISGTNIFTNMFSYFVFSRFRTPTLLHRLLKYLSLCEVMFQALFFVFTIVEERLLSGQLIFHNLGTLKMVMGFYLFTIIPALTASHITRNWIICIVSMYRFEVVCRALAHRFLLFRRPENLIKIVLFVVMLAILFSMPRFIERKTFVSPLSSVFNSSTPNDEENESGFLVLALGARAYSIQVYKWTYTLMLLFILQTGGPTICVCTLNFFLVVKLIKRQKMQTFLRSGNYNNPNPTSHKPVGHQAQPSRSSAASSSRGERLVIVLCVCFFVFEMPSFLSKSLGATKLLTNSSSEMLANIANFATALDSSINIFVYIFSNREFRRQLCSLLGLKSCAEPRGNYNLTQNECRSHRKFSDVDCSAIPLRRVPNNPETEFNCEIINIQPS